MNTGAFFTSLKRVLAALLMTGVLASAASAAAPAPAMRTVLVVGDSLSAAYGIRPEQGWVALLGQRLRAEGLPWRVVNASVSGETTAGGHARFAQELQRTQPQVVVLALGANDGLRGLPLAQSKANLGAMITAAQAAKARVLIIGMRLPPNYGPDYTQGFERSFRELANQHRTAFLPFLLEPIADERESFQADNLHPIAQAQPRLLEHVWTALAPLLVR